MMLQIQKKQKSNFFLKKAIILKSLVAICATGLFAVEGNSDNLKGLLSQKKASSTLLKPKKGISDEEYDRFILGRSFFKIPWVEAPSATTARDGLGPLFNANTCNSCHPKNGRGNLYNEKNQISRALIAKVSILSNGSKDHKMQEKYNGLVIDPNYGGQISINAIHGIKYEAKPKITYEEIEVKFPDGEVDTILKPKYSLIDKNYGELHKDARLTFRLAPSLNGLGLLEDIKQEDILANEDENDSNNDGISGRANWAYSPITKKVELGLYSWKASTTTILHQSAGAAHNDMGLTTTIFPNENCTKSQKLCNEAPKPRDPIDITDERIQAIDFYIQNKKTYQAKQDDAYKAGLELFKSVDCNKCHVSSFTTKSGLKIAPFTDMLLHDMGEGLSDGRSEFKANAQEWRTAPLWGLALHEKINKKAPRLLHDGRARNFQEAILWHGGEASIAKEKYMKLSKNDREKLIKFLKEL